MVDVEVGAGLVTAARGGHVPVVRYLLQECGADASLYGPTALRVALEDGRLEAVCLLLEAGTPTDDVVALTQAARRGLRRFNPEQFDTVLQAATQHGHVEFAEMLRDLRATAN
jgi:ankyrin repeat protein